MRKKPSCAGVLESNASQTPRIVVAGAGAVGCFVGGLLARAGHTVSFLGRRRIFDSLRDNGLWLTGYDGLDISLPADALDLHESPHILRKADIILVCVKSAATANMASLICDYAQDGAVVISLQNGMGHADTLRAALPEHDIRPAMVPFNVVPMAQGRFHRANSGDIVIGAGPHGLDTLLSNDAMTVTQSAEIEAFQWGKLLLNLNNAPNALSGLSLYQQLLSPQWRSLLAEQLEEALGVVRAHGCAVKLPIPVPMGLVPYILRLPTPLFRRIAARMLQIDPQARTSMAYDLDAGRPTEVDAFQGRIIAMGLEKSIPTPLSLSLLEKIKAAEEERAQGFRD